MKKNFLFCILAISAFSVAAEMNSLKEIMNIMKDSKVMYSVKELKKPIPVPDRSANLNGFVYRTKAKDGYKFEDNLLTDQAKKIYHEGEKQFESRNYAKARELYKEAFKLSPKYTLLQTFIAQTYGIEQNWKEAETWYKKAIKDNFVDYLAHWLLADVYLQTGDKKNALQEISIAKVLNRNNPNLEKKRQEIFRKNELDDTNWTFNPQIRVEKTKPNEVAIYADTVWMFYGFVEAVWNFEPGYKEKQQQSSRHSDIEQREKLISLSTGIERGWTNIEVIKRIDKAFKGEKINEFIFYEMILPDHPNLIFLQDEKTIGELANYIIWMNMK